jgi:hypothetical protein
MANGLPAWFPERIRAVRPRILLAVGVWFVLMAIGWTQLVRYETTPGIVGTVPEAWPAELKFPGDGTQACLVLAIHPQCPCSRATLDELDEILTRTGDRLRVVVLVSMPAETREVWEQSEIYQRVLQVANADVRPDTTGELVAQFGAITSGHALVYSADRQLKFSGGLTAARGQTGTNQGRTAVLEHLLLAKSRLALVRTDVFGCPLCRAEKPSLPAASPP